jgi:ABC-2 type transport system permease protein
MSGFATSLSRVGAIFSKEMIQMRRDRLTLGMMFIIPIIQLILFGYAINLNPKNLPTAIHIGDPSPIARTLVQGLETSGYFHIKLQTQDPAEADDWLARGKVAFIIAIPADFSEKLIRGERPQILIEADATDPAAASNAIAQAEKIFELALRHDLKGPLADLNAGPPPFDLVLHSRYNPEAITQFNIVPGLLGVILTMTLVMITSIAMTRETERGTLENLLAMPSFAYEVMIGKIMPYVAVGLLQTVIILLAAKLLFGVPFQGSLLLLSLAVGVFVVANLSLGFTFSTLVETQMQALQLTFFFFLPSILLSGFMFPFRGMPQWAQYLGEILPLTHFLRIVRGVMLKGANFEQLHQEFLAILVFTLAVGLLAMARYRRTLD